MDEPIPLETPPPIAKRGIGLGFVILLLLLLLGFSAYVYYDMSRRLALLESRLERLPQETISAIIAYQNGDAQASTTQSGSISIDDDAYVGDRSNAQLAIVEFSDFNCPYCAKFHAETHEKLLDNYVRSGQVIYVYRDYVGVGGNVTLAAAAAAECVRAQSDDQVYLGLVKAIYASSGTRNVELVKALAETQGMDMAALEACLKADTFRQEVIDDTRAAQAAGVRGTPAFVIGQLHADGTVSGESIPGAQAFEYFEAVIQKLTQQD